MGDVRRGTIMANGLRSRPVGAEAWRAGRSESSVGRTSRRDAMPTAAPSDDFDLWLEAVTERIDPLMTWLGVVFALLVGYEFAVEVGDRTAVGLEVAGWTIWSVFLLGFGAKLWLAPKKRLFLRRHWLQAPMLLVPTLRVLRFIRLLRLGRALPAARVVSSSYRTAGTARRLFRLRLG